MELRVQKVGGACLIRATRDDGAVLKIRPTSPRDLLPHDLVHYVVESELGLEWGFWGMLAAGQLYQSITIVRPPTRAIRLCGRRALAKHQADAQAAEALVGEHSDAWRRFHKAARGPQPTDKVVAAFEAMNQRWQSLSNGQSFTLTWPHTSRRSRLR